MLISEPGTTLREKRKDPAASDSAEMRFCFLLGVRYEPEASKVRGISGLLLFVSFAKPSLIQRLYRR